ncbi:Protein TIME FOR COFFEE [Quillaja saponaria]|uniref:Protein TIME FOR COFFEE n=1 Tax=Quillaja saponaria TaxID=32244 RepID=A0AAD7VJ26_QUISA|nr:Protein TIME FOR COFFEE [Quillaja saponaria]
MLRDRPNKRVKNRDRDSTSGIKRRRGSRREEGEERTEDSVGDADEYEVDDAGVSPMLSPNTASSASDQNHRWNMRLRLAPPARNVADEMIGVPVPRKARSASTKRSYENWASVSGGGEEQNSRQQPNSTARLSVEAASPSSSSVSVRKKMKRFEASKSSSLTEEDIEIEIAEVLYGLMTSTKHGSAQKLDENDTNAPKKKKMEDDNSSAPALRSSNAESKLQPQEKTSAPESAKISRFNDNTTIGGTWLSEEIKDNERGNLDSVAGGGVTVDEESISSIGESLSGSKLDADGQDSAATKVISTFTEKFEIDLMAPPPMEFPLEKDGFTIGDFTSKSKPVMEPQENTTKVEDNMERLVKKEKVTEELEQKMKMVREKRNMRKLDLEKENKDTGGVIVSKLERQCRKQEQQPRYTNFKEENTDRSSVPLPIALAGPSGLPPLGYVPPFQTVVSVDGIARSLGELQPAHFVLSQPRAKRCATHDYIARNIFLHQQYTKMNHFWPAVGSASLSAAKSNNLNGKPSKENMTVGNQLQRSLLDMTLNHAPQKGWAATNSPGLTANKNLDAANSEEAAHRKQLLFQQLPQPASSDNLMHVPTFLFPLSQHQAPVVTSANQSGVANSTNNASLSIGSASESLGTSSALPAVAAAVSFSYPNFATNEAPYLAIVQNNGYLLPFSTPASRRGSSLQATSKFNSPYFPSQTFHPSQLLQQQPHSWSPIQSTYHNISTTSSSSHNQPRGAHLSGNNSLTSTNMQLQQPPNQKVSLPFQSPKLETRLSGENTSSVANHSPYSQRSSYKLDFSVPVQPQNFSIRASAALGSVGGNSGDYGEKKQQQQQHKQKQQQVVTAAVDLIPSQAFAISFAALNGTSTPSSLNFSTTARNPVIFQSLPHMGRKGCQVLGTSVTTQKKRYLIPEGKPGGNSTCAEDEKKVISGKLSTTGPITPVFDNSARTLNFISSPVTGSWPSHPITATAITANAPLTSIASSSHQTHVFQLQKQHIMQQQQPTIAARNKSPTSKTPSNSTMLSNNAPIFSQRLLQCNSSVQFP